MGINKPVLVLPTIPNPLSCAHHAQSTDLHPPPCTDSQDSWDGAVHAWLLLPVAADELSGNLPYAVLEATVLCSSITACRVGFTGSQGLLIGSQPGLSSTFPPS